MLGAHDGPKHPGASLVRSRRGDEEVVVLRLSWLQASELLGALSVAEREVVALALEGRSNLEIAGARGTSARTVANQLASIFRKLAVGSRAELARLCALAPHSTR